jgi:hypothetical protein
MNKDQEGGNIIPDLVNLGMPLGLSILANNLDKSSENEKNEKKSQKGGDILSNNLLLELGLSIVPFGLIALSDTGNYSADKKNENKKKDKK